MLFKSFVRGERGAKLRSQLAALRKQASAEEIEDAIQSACDRFVDKADAITEPGQIYSRLRTTAHRILNREDDHRQRELAVDSTTDVGLRQLAAEEPAPRKRRSNTRTKPNWWRWCGRSPPRSPSKSVKSSPSTTPV